MSEAISWMELYDDNEWENCIFSADHKRLFAVRNATPEQVRQVCALPKIMAALKEWTEANAAMSDAWEGDMEEPAAERLAAADAALRALYERLR